MRPTSPMSASSLRTPIRIKPSHEGLLHKKLGIPEGKKIPSNSLTVKPGDSPSTVKQKTFAMNSKHWSKK